MHDNKTKTFNCFDVSSNDRLLTAGSDLFDGDAFLLFWDTRSSQCLGGYWDSHTDDITQVMLIIVWRLQFVHFNFFVGEIPSKSYGYFNVRFYRWFDKYL